MMRIFQETLELKTKRSFQYINITDRIQDIVNKSKIKQGMAFVNTPHNTATVIIQEDDPSIHEDTKLVVEDIVPLEREYLHSYEGNINATSHIKNQILGNSNLCIPIKDGKLMLGVWQQIFFVEFLEGRSRKVVITIMGTSK